MSGRIDIFLLDKSNNLIEEANILKPKSYDILNTTLKRNLKNLPEFLLYFILHRIIKKSKYTVMKNINY